MRLTSRIGVKKKREKNQPCAFPAPSLLRVFSIFIFRVSRVLVARLSCLHCTRVCALKKKIKKRKQPIKIRPPANHQPRCIKAENSAFVFSLSLRFSATVIIANRRHRETREFDKRLIKNGFVALPPLSYRAIPPGRAPTSKNARRFRSRTTATRRDRMRARK